VTVTAAMAERVRLSLPAGSRLVHAVSLSYPAGECDGPSSSEKAAEVLGAAGEARKGSFVLQWTAVVLDELTVELEVFAQLCALTATPSSASSSAPGEVAAEEATGGVQVLLERAACGRTFSGSFAPARDRRLLPAGEALLPAAGPVRPEAVLFSFSNAFSWFSSKEVELVTLWDWHPHQQATAPPSEDLPPPPEVGEQEIAANEGEQVDAEEWLPEAESEAQEGFEAETIEAEADPQEDLAVTEQEGPEDEEAARKARALAIAQRYGVAM